MDENNNFENINETAEVETVGVEAEAAETEAEDISARLRAEYESAKRAEKQREKFAAGAYSAQNDNVAAAKNEPSEAREKRGLSVWACVGIAAGSAIAGAVLVFVLLFCVKLPGREISFMQAFVRGQAGYGSSSSGSSDSSSGDYTTEPEGTVVGGTEVPGGSDVTINIDGATSEDNAAAVYAKCDASVVGIRVVTVSNPWENNSTTVGEGSGVVYTEDGYIITNHHVIEQAIGSQGNVASGYEIRVFFDKDLTTYSTAKIVGTDSTTDLAVIKVNGENLQPITIGDSSKVSVGDKVFAIGSPGGLEFINSLSDGIVSGVGRNVSTDTGVAYDLIQTNTAINPGNSGGALLNREGELIGVCFLKIVADGYEGMGFAISSNTVKDIVGQLMENGKVSRPQLGVTVNTTYTETEANRNNLPAGAWVVEVSKNSPADKAGVEVNNIITEFNGVKISNYTELREELLKYKPNDNVSLKLYCYDTLTGDGEYKEVVVTLGEAE